MPAEGTDVEDMAGRGGRVGITPKTRMRGVGFLSRSERFVGSRAADTHKGIENGAEWRLKGGDQSTNQEFFHQSAKENEYQLLTLGVAEC